MPFVSCVSLARVSWCAFFLWTLAATLGACGVEPPTQERPFAPGAASAPVVPDDKVPVVPQPTAPVPEPPPVEHDSEPEPEPCVDVVCALHSSCVPSVGACACDDGFSKAPDGTCVKVNEDYGFIGAACTADSDCSFAGGKCLLEDDGYARGHCTQSCASVCPDRDNVPVTFCTTVQRPSAAPTCFAQCDYQQYPNTNGCRPDYSCVSASRAGDAEVFRAVCVPTSWGLSESCDDPTNFAQSNACYLQQASFGDAEAEGLLESLLQGVATAQQAERFLDLNYSGSQTFIRDEITTTFNNNYTPGHSSSRPMRGMIVHYTASQREDGTIRYFLSADPHGSSHFIVGSYRNGLIVQLFSHRHRTWHAGGNYNPDYFGFDFANAGYLRRSNGAWRDYAGENTCCDCRCLGASLCG
jgi:hypothetical protein